MFYIKDNEQIVLADDIKQNIINSLEFMPQYEGYEILETTENEVIMNFKLMTTDEAKAEEEQEEAERIAHLYLTAADVERGIYKAKGLDFNDIISMVQTQQPDQVKALKIELKANNFYRGNRYVETIGKMLGFTDKQLNLFFEDGNYKHLLEI